MSEHTPGPWRVGSWYEGRLAVIVEDVSDMRIITELTGANLAHEANARLIAAAPELLEALGTIARFIKDGDEIDGEEHEMSIDDAFQTAADAIDIARAAVAKAKGE
jgi:hypothetical protein